MVWVNFCNPRAASWDTLPRRYHPASGLAKALSGGQVRVLGPALSQKKGGWVAMPGAMQGVHKERDRKGLLTPPGPALLMAISHYSVVFQWRSNSWEIKRREKRVSLILWESCFEAVYQGKQLCLYVMWNITVYFFLFSALLLFSVWFFFFFFIQGPGHCFWASLSRTDT